MADSDDEAEEELNNLSLQELEDLYGDKKKRALPKDKINKGSQTNIFRLSVILILMLISFLLFTITNILLSEKLKTLNHIYNTTSLTYYKSTYNFNILRERYINNPIILKNLKSDEEFEKDLIAGFLNDEEIYNVIVNS